MLKHRTPVFVLLVAVLLLSACNFPTKATSTPQVSAPDAVNTAAAQTVSAMETQISSPETQAPPGATQSPQASIPTATLAAPSATPAPTTTLTPATACDWAGFVTDVTVPDGTTMTPGQQFTKTWRLKNKGTCTWSTSYKMVFISGNAMNGPATMALPSSVAPGQTIDLSVSLTAPSTANNYQGSWMLQNASGVNFGLGANADQPFWVKITVGSAPFAVTHMDISVDNASYAGACPHTFSFTANITVTAAGNITFYWEGSDGSKSAVQSLGFSAAGSKTATYTWALNSTGSYSIKIYNDAPNHQYFAPANFSLTCQ